MTRRLALVATLALLAARPAPAAPPAGHWTHAKPILLPALDQPAFVEALLDAETYREAAASLADLRIRDGRGTEVAYVLRRRETPPTRQQRDAPLLDRQETAAREVRFTLDLGAGAAVHNRVRIGLGPEPRNFRVPVRIETSEDRRAWHLVRAAGFIYRVEGETRAADTAVGYPPATARYLRVTVAPWEGRPLPVTAAAVIAETAAVRDEEPVAAALLGSRDDGDARQTRLVFDLGGRRPVDRAELDIGDATFHRLALIEASDDGKAWRSVGRGALSAIDTRRLRDRQTSLGFPETTARYRRITIENADDRPLRISAVRFHAVRRGIVFRAEPGQAYRLEYGNAQAPAPRYDLARAFPYVASEPIALARLGPASPLPPPAPARRPWTEGRPVLLWGAMAVVALLLGGMLVRLARQIGRPLPADDHRGESHPAS